MSFVIKVDADTKVYPDSLRYLVNCMHHDQMIMGVCGETRIANKRQSWVTAIQVYEYFISHHLAKAFESVFGGVTCLPGCFSMFRLKARKASGDDWVPLIIKPEIVREYSQCEVTTLHQKNLLLLGEDRFLTTCLLRTFPNRKMMFLPQAKCRTVAPDTFSVLLSQRRRWINSTIHNLMELVLVQNLCGTFCFSMQFVVLMDLVGTTVLPIAIALTYSLIVGMAMNPPHTFEEAIPLMLLLAVIGLPAILILITTRKVVYIFWMLIYLLALPIWNFVLPVYSFWHFDDFSWGETRYAFRYYIIFYTTNRLLYAEKWQGKAREKLTERVEVFSMVRQYPCAAGKTGNVVGCGRSSAKSGDVVRWNEHSQEGMMLMATDLTFVQRFTVNMTAQTPCLSLRLMRINGGLKSEHTMKIARPTLLPPQEYYCLGTNFLPRRTLSTRQIWKPCWNMGLIAIEVRLGLVQVPILQVRTFCRTRQARICQGTSCQTPHPNRDLMRTRHPPTGVICLCHRGQLYLPCHRLCLRTARAPRSVLCKHMHVEEAVVVDVQVQGPMGMVL